MLQSNLDTIQTAIQSLMTATDIFEVRVLGADGNARRTKSTYLRYQDIEDFAIKLGDESENAIGGVFFTPQVVNPECKRRALRSLRWVGKHDKCTSDGDILGRRYLILDIDPVRPPGESATDSERAAAWSVYESAAAVLGQPKLLADSGNGLHGYYELSATITDADDRLKLALWLLAKRYDTPAAKIDRSVYNPARIMRIPGTLNRKGLNTTERPYRVTSIVGRASDAVPVDLDALINVLDPAGELREMYNLPPVYRQSIATTEPTDENTKIRRASAYLAKMEPGIQGAPGNPGSNPTYAAAAAMVHGFALDEEQAYQLLASEYNPRCVPEWSEHELRHKVHDAATKPHSKPRGWILESDYAAPDEEYKLDESAEAWAARFSGKAPRPPEKSHGGPLDQKTTAPAKIYSGDIDNTRRLAQMYLDLPENEHLKSYREEFIRWEGGAYIDINTADIRDQLNRFIGDQFANEHIILMQNHAENGGDKKPPKLLSVTNNLVNNVLGVIRGLRNVPHSVEAPAWLDSVDGPDPSSLISCRNGIYCLNSGELLPASPSFLTFNSTSFDFDKNAQKPTNWLNFLHQIWEDDQESIDSLQEWFGYLLTTDNNQQKLLFVVGPRRAGKGTIASVMTALIGKRNIANPTLSGMSEQFGLMSLIGKSVAIVPDAQISKRADSESLAEKLKAITGNDYSNIDRKNKRPLEIRLGTRFVIMSNELPKIIDGSTALSGRFVLLQLTKTFYGKEDTKLAERIIANDLPGVMLWAIEGLNRLRSRGNFLQPASGLDGLTQITEMASPVKAFIDDRCELGNGRISCMELYTAWRSWCEDQGIKTPGSAIMFGRDLRSACSKVTRWQVRQGSDRFWEYRGIRLKAENSEETTLFPVSNP